MQPSLISTVRRGKTTLLAEDASINGTVWELPAGPLALGGAPVRVVLDATECRFVAEDLVPRTGLAIDCEAGTLGVRLSP